MERLAGREFRRMPRLLGVVRDATIEEDVAGVSALQVEPPPGSLDVAIEALAAFHAQDWGGRANLDTHAMLPDEETPLFRLGFSSAEREPATTPLREARAVMRETAAGLAMCYATAEHMLLGIGEAWLVDFGSAASGLQLFDVAAFLVTSGIEPDRRRRLTTKYAHVRGLDGETTADAVDLASIVWGIEHELSLPRRQILAMGDEAAMERLVLASARVNRAFRDGAGKHPLAVAIRAALWPS
jgi:hypothetical protein